MQAWEQEVAEFEIRYAKRVDEDAKILAVKSIMPKTLFGEAGVFRGRSFSTNASITRYLDDKVPVSTMTKSSSSSVTPSFVQNLLVGEGENEEEDKDSITQEELFAMVQQFRKGKGKGKSMSKGKGVCWHCGDGDHYSRDCPNDKHDSWTENVVERPTRLTNQQRFKQRKGHRKNQLEQCQRKRERVTTVRKMELDEGQVWKEGQRKYIQR